MSRVSAYDWMGSTALRPAGFIAVGPLAAAIGTRATLAAAAAVVVAISAATLAVRDVRTIARE